MNGATIAWIVFGGVICLGCLALLVQEIPSIRRELRLMSM